MNEIDLLENKEYREKLVAKVEVLEKVKKLLLIPGTEVCTIKQASEFYEVDDATIKMLIMRNREELQEDGLKSLSGTETKEFLGSNKLLPRNLRGGFEIEGIEGIRFNNKSNVLLPRRAILRIGMLLRDSAVAKEIRSQLLNIEESVSNDQKISKIEEEEKLIMNVAKAFNSGSKADLLTATSELNQFKNRYIKELEPKAKYYDNVIQRGDAVTSTIWTRIKDREDLNIRKFNGKESSLGEMTIEILDYLHSFINKNGYCPSFREIASAMEVKSTSSIQMHMNKLFRLGYIAKNANSPRNTRVNEEKYVELMKKYAVAEPV